MVHAVSRGVGSKSGQISNAAFTAGNRGCTLPEAVCGLTLMNGQCLSGSAPLPREVADAFEQLSGGVVVEGYGLMEASR
jgi:hypothetical protein